MALIANTGCKIGNKWNTRQLNYLFDNDNNIVVIEVDDLPFQIRMIL